MPRFLAAARSVCTRREPPRETFAQHSAGTAETGIRHGLDLAELHAFLFEPVDTFGDVVRIGAVKGLITHLLRNIHHHGVEGFSRIFDTLLLLMTRTPAANRAQRVNGIAVRTVAFSKSTTLAPKSWAVMAVIRPAGPAPTTIAS